MLTDRQAHALRHLRFDLRVSSEGGKALMASVSPDHIDTVRELVKAKLLRAEKQGEAVSMTIRAHNLLDDWYCHAAKQWRNRMERNSL